MKKLILLFVFIHCNLNYAQTLYLCDASQRIMSYNQNGQPTLIKQFDFAYNDIAISSLGEIYTTTGGRIDRYNVVSDDFTQVFFIPPNIGYNTSLTAGYNNDLYFLTEFNNLCRYDITNNTFEVLANLGLHTPGDIVFYKGNILFEADGTNKIRAYNVNNQTMNIVFCLPLALSYSYGIANHYNSCGENIIILSHGSNFYEIDLENDTIETLNFSHTSVINGLATSTEYLASNCNTSLTANPCYLSVEDYDFLNSGLLFYPNPVGDYLNIKENIVYDSFSIFDVNGRIIVTSEKNKRTLNVSELNSGVYFFKIVKGEQSRIEKFVKN